MVELDKLAVTKLDSKMFFSAKVPETWKNEGYLHVEPFNFASWEQVLKLKRKTPLLKAKKSLSVHHSSRVERVRLKWYSLSPFFFHVLKCLIISARAYVPVCYTSNPCSNCLLYSGRSHLLFCFSDEFRHHGLHRQRILFDARFIFTWIQEALQ